MSPRFASTTKPVAWLDMFHSVSNARVWSTWIVTTPVATRSSVLVQRESSGSGTETTGGATGSAARMNGAAISSGTKARQAAANVLCMWETVGSVTRDRGNGKFECGPVA